MLRRFTVRKAATAEEVPGMCATLAALASARTPRWPLPLVTRPARACPLPLLASLLLTAAVVQLLPNGQC